MPNKLLTPQEIAERLGFRVDTVYSWIRNGKLPAYRIGGLYRVDEEDLKAMIGPKV